MTDIKRIHSYLECVRICTNAALDTKDADNLYHYTALLVYELDNVFNLLNTSYAEMQEYNLPVNRQQRLHRQVAKAQQDMQERFERHIAQQSMFSTDTLPTSPLPTMEINKLAGNNTEEVILPLTLLRQNDNVLNPHQTCNTTAIAMCLQYYGIVGDGSMEQLEDQITNYMSQNGYNRYDMESMTRFVNDKYGSSTTAVFSQNMSVNKLISVLTSGCPVIISGRFTPSWHFVVLRGFDCKERVFHVLDPNGEYYETGYDTGLGAGNGIETYSFNLISNLCNDPGHTDSIWAIVFEKANTTR